MSEGLAISSVGDQLGQDGKEGRVFKARAKKRFRDTVLNVPVSISRGTLLAVKQFRKTKSPNRILREAVFQQRAASVGVAPLVFGVHTKDKYIVMERCDTRIIDVYAGRTLPDGLQYMICALMARLDGENILHNDGNALNLMLRKKKPVLVDYGFAKNLKRGKSNFKITLWAIVHSLKRHRIVAPILERSVKGNDVASYITNGEHLLS